MGKFKQRESDNLEQKKDFEYKVLEEISMPGTSIKEIDMSSSEEESEEDNNKVRSSQKSKIKIDGVKLKNIPTYYGSDLFDMEEADEEEFYPQEDEIVEDKNEIEIPDSNNEQSESELIQTNKNITPKKMFLFSLGLVKTFFNSSSCGGTKNVVELEAITSHNNDSQGPRNSSN